ncbi:oxygen tolerance protein BatD [Prosthecobacter fusiformis]|uniref:Oxygen tolerance protein BatD n=2 Tax=Prosthecobacter fusiformis TaxID=48464 RepID=A0A4R7RPB6_9BACT|nr:oxygen tolerance protein BatD [Prosthecobacter fusiformis]
MAMLVIAGAAEAATIRAYVQPEKVRPNQVVSYVITVQDGSVERMSELRLPLQLIQNTAVSTSQQFSITNGRQTSSVRLTWGISASEPGDFVIPAQSLKVNGQMMTTNEVKLTVAQGGGDEAVAAADDANKPILQLELGKTEIYQGEVMPLNCTLYIPRQTPLRRIGLVDIEKSDFAIARFPQQNDQTTTTIDGVGYVVLTFRSTLSSLRTGELKVGPASMELLVEVPVEDSPRQNMFPPNFPPGFFPQMTEPRKVVVQSQPVTLRVLPMPAEGKPANFSGAVGDFILSASASPTELTVGDPVAVELMVEGTGNFDALNAPALTEESGWKSYPAKRYNIEGQLDQNQVPTLDRKVGYSQVFIPEAVHKELPPFEINFFSPTKKQYVTLKTEAIPLNMKPAPVTAASESAAGAAGEAVPLPPLLVPDPQPDITDILINPPATSRWLVPTGNLLLRSPTFWTVQAVPVGLLFLASFLAMARRRREALMAGRAGQLRAAWAGLDQGSVADGEFLRRAAQFIHTAKAGEPVQEPELKTILDRYEGSNFAAVASAPVTPEERRQITQTLSGLFNKALSKVTALVMLGLLCCGTLGAQEAKPEVATADAVYQEALEEMTKGNYARAQYLAESLTKKKPPQLSSEVFQLIGHARYRQEDPGRAVLWYQRAQLFDPRAPELRQNLRHLYEKLRFVSYPFESPLSQWSLWLTPNEWLILASAGFWLVLLSAAWRILVGRKGLPWAVAMSLIGIFIAVPATAFASIRPLGAERVRDISIVTMPEARAYTGATVTSGTVMDLPAGSQVRILEKRGAWNYVEIPNRPENLRGWVEGAAITPLWIWDEKMVP